MAEEKDKWFIHRTTRQDISLSCTNLFHKVWQYLFCYHNYEWDRVNLFDCQKTAFWNEDNPSYDPLNEKILEILVSFINVYVIFSQNNEN